MRLVQVTALLAAVAVTASTAAGAPTDSRPTLRFVGLKPVTARGTNFLPREQVRVTLRAGTVKRVRTVGTSAAGELTVNFGFLRERDRCGVAMRLSAVGAGGDRVTYRLPPRECPTMATSRHD